MLHSVEDSFQIGAVTAAARLGVPDLLVVSMQ